MNRCVTPHTAEQQRIVRALYPGTRACFLHCDSPNEPYDIGIVDLPRWGVVAAADYVSRVAPGSGWVLSGNKAAQTRAAMDLGVALGAVLVVVNHDGTADDLAANVDAAVAVTANDAGVPLLVFVRGALASFPASYASRPQCLPYVTVYGTGDARGAEYMRAYAKHVHGVAQTATMDQCTERGVAWWEEVVAGEE